ncbi:feline leukemia virus subgroup C receptor-related protein 2 [Caerostris darwini]|uniref:Feline leukemia virus subgroup C receptor-related protein 2 n=1 Tax=Caerostris darwini TaxID=1538125 RepID=A0AAV4Q5I0_9ARAC|nr:feline leukemia virus subgroup C receptor-related protein 2 [Caerostris darwini]
MRNADCKKRMQVSLFLKSILMPGNMPAQRCICSTKNSGSTTRRHLCSRDQMSSTEFENRSLIHSSFSDHPVTHNSNSIMEDGILLELIIKRFYAEKPRKKMEDYQKNGSKTGCFDVYYYNKNLLVPQNHDPINTNVSGTKYNVSPNETYGTSDNHNSTEKPTAKDVENSTRKQSCAGEIQLYKKRYLMLFLFAMCSMMNGFPNSNTR